MQRRQIVMNLRTSGKLKGGKPCMVYFKSNLGKIYTEGRSDFVMSLSKDVLHFQKITTFLRRLKPSEDLSFPISRFKEYTFFRSTFYNTLCLYDAEKKYLEIHYNVGIADTFPTEDNISRIIKVLEEKGIKEIDLEKDVMKDEKPNSQGEGTNKEV